MTSTADPKCQGPNPPARPNIAIYSGGNSKMDNLKEFFGEIGAAGYTTVLLWAAHIDSAGNIGMNGDPLVVDGNFQPSAQLWADVVNAMRPPSGKVTRIELSIGGDQKSFLHIKALMDQYHAEPNNPLYQNLQALQKAVPLDAVNYDDESVCDLESSTELAVMCASLGMRVSMCPYDWPQYWTGLVTAINDKVPGTADAVYLQCYDGGAANQPGDWSESFQPTGLGITPGLWATHEQDRKCTLHSSASDVMSQMAAWSAQSDRYPLAGGFIFCGTDMVKCPNGGTPKDYATAISRGLESTAPSS
jgi:hypothetical protein